MNVFLVVAQGKTCGSYVPLYGVVIGAFGTVGLCALGLVERCELATSGTAQSRARPLNRKSAPSATRAALKEEFVFITFCPL